MITGEYKPDYLWSELIFFTGSGLAEICIYWAARIKFRNDNLIRHVLQWYIDLSLADMLFLILGNPYIWEPNKLVTMGVATLMFITAYYFEYVALWHWNWVDKVKTFYHEHFKNKRHGRD